MTSSPNLAIRLSPNALKHVRQGHPWVFDGGIESVRGGRYGDGTGEILQRRRSNPYFC